MKEAQSDRYFTDGFFIKHFKKYPVGIDEQDFFDEQKIFVMYLIGVIPSFDDWSYRMSYCIEKESINDMTIKDVTITQEEYDLCKMKNGNIEDIKRKELIKKKDEKLKELNKKYGIKEEEENKDEEIIIPKINKNTKETIEEKNKRMWDMINGKNVVKQDG